MIEVNSEGIPIGWKVGDDKTRYNSLHYIEDTEGCRFCKNQSAESLPVRTNCDMLAEQFITLMADMGNRKEIVIHTKGKAYGIPVNFCPFCGRMFDGRNIEFIESYKEEI